MIVDNLHYLLLVNDNIKIQSMKDLHKLYRKARAKF